MNRYLIVLWLLTLPLVASGQWGISPQIGFGSYNLEGIRFSRETQEVYVVWDHTRSFNDQKAELHLLDNFPPYFNFGISFHREKANGSVSRAGYSFLTTGARYYYEDYSGYVAMDYNANAHVFSYTFAMPITRKFEQLHWYISPALLLGKYKHHTEFDVAGEIFYSYSSVIGYAINLGGTAGLEYVWHIKEISISTSAGYYMDLYSGEFQPGGWFDFYSPYNHQKLAWRGFRGTVAVNIPFVVLHRKQLYKRSLNALRKSPKKVAELAVS